MKYVVKKSIPLAIPLKKGDVIDSKDVKYNFLDFKDVNFFERYSEPLYKEGDELLIKLSSYHREKLFKITKVLYNKQYEVYDGSTHIVISEKTKVRKPTNFWFINSNGKICPDYEERFGIDKEGLDFKKQTGNYFKTIEEARIYRDSLIK